MAVADVAKKEIRWDEQGLFRRLPEKALEKLKASAQKASYPKGAVLFREGEPAEKLFIIVSGWVQIVRRVVNSQALTLDLVTPRDPCCGLSACTGGRYMATAVAGTPVTAAILPSSVLKSLMEEHAGMASQVARLINTRYRHIAWAYSYAFAPVTRRIAAALLRFSEDFGRTLPLMRREVAALAGTTVETSIRVTRRMEKAGWVRMRRGRIEILLPEALEQEAHPEEAAG